MQRARRWPKVFAIAVPIAICAVALLAWATTVPYRDIDTVEYFAQRGLVSIEHEPSFAPLIRRAQVDYWIAPTPFPGRCTLMYAGAGRRADELHLVFWAPVASKNRVIYVFSEHTRRPEWKTQIDID